MSKKKKPNWRGPWQAGSVRFVDYLGEWSLYHNGRDEEMPLPKWLQHALTELAEEEQGYGGNRELQRVRKVLGVI